jgi:hypothetical protein
LEIFKVFNVMQKSLPSVMSHSFSNVPQARIPRSQFKRNFSNTTTFNADYLIPFYTDEVYPGDTVNANFAAIVRMITPLTPFMDNLYIDSFFFFVPLRLIQDNWQKLMGERVDPDDDIDYATPKMSSTASTGYIPPTDWSSVNTTNLAAALQDYFGIPTAVPDLEHHNYFGRAYNLIYNEWFRDQNLQDSVVVDKDDGPDTVTDYILLKRGKRHDYFTSCLPWLQKGVAEDLPLGTSAPVISDGNIPELLGQTSGESGQVGWDTTHGLVLTNGTGSFTNAEEFEFNSTNTGLVVDLTTATAATIGQLYESFAIQDLLQTDARGGTRYVELINAHFGVTSPDFRLQRPEYLGGSSDPFIVSPLAQTSQTDSTELGTLAATATAGVNRMGFFKSFVEHGVILGIINVRADLRYQQGLHRMFSRSTRYDFYFPALANLGEQEVLNKEIFSQGSADATADAAVFGYQERWSELRYGRNIITGRMRSNAGPAGDGSLSLDPWHLSEDFAALPVLNDAFIVGNTPIDRVTAVTSEPHFKGDFYGDCTWVRPMPLYSVPGLMNRF